MIILPAIPKHESIFCKLDFYCNAIVIDVVYHAPTADLVILKHLYNYVQYFWGENIKFVLARYFNLPNIDSSAINTVGTNVRHSDILTDVAFSCGLAQIVTAPTGITATARHVRSVLFIGSTIRCVSVDVMNGLSDQKLAFATLSFKKMF